jgi:hypothetical protein
MNLWTKLSLTLNAWLLGLVVWMGAAGPRPETHPEASPLPSHHGLCGRPQPVSPLASVGSFPEVVEITEPFRWAQVESSDYRVYLANLRALGCPEQTVRDIIIADVNDLFNGRVKALVDEVSGRFWELIIHQDDFEKMVNEKHSQLRALDDERDEVFTALFGDRDPRSSEHLENNAADRRVQ